jgi:hypothetical protein
MAWRWDGARRTAAIAATRDAGRSRRGPRGSTCITTVAPPAEYREAAVTNLPDGHQGPLDRDSSVLVTRRLVLYINVVIINKQHGTVVDCRSSAVGGSGRTFDYRNDSP